MQQELMHLINKEIMSIRQYYLLNQFVLNKLLTN